MASCVLLFPTLYHTHIVLLSKCDCPERVTDFRPISLCNVIYKIASKAIANRLKPFLGSIISESQSAFVLGCLITDNVLVAHELNFYLAHKYWGSSDHILLKLDISKAYDRVEWLFLERMLVRLDFHAKFVHFNHAMFLICVLFVLVDWDCFGLFEIEKRTPSRRPSFPIPVFAMCKGL
ncbi:UNVERIFIED_CONTAM: hypothetical protein Slati_1507800 [Sesamum latifolium]|uniref:Reverse transcriptase domain-containing protein n=1 Tax=Sesamum latifolium TaxID=2727402 RepID=A0AAW2X6S3_9LAMI